MLNIAYLVVNELFREIAEELNCAYYPSFAITEESLDREFTPSLNFKTRIGYKGIVWECWPTARGKILVYPHDKPYKLYDYCNINLKEIIIDDIISISNELAA